MPSGLRIPGAAARRFQRTRCVCRPGQSAAGERVLAQRAF